MKSSKLFSFTLMGLFFAAALLLVISACRREEGVAIQTHEDDGMLAELASRYYKPATPEQAQLDREARMKLTFDQAARLLDKMHAEEVKDYEARRSTMTRQPSAKQDDQDAAPQAMFTAEEYAGIRPELDAVLARKKQANKEAFAKFKKNFFALSENEKMQLDTFKGFGLKPLSNAQAKTQCGAYCTQANCPIRPGSGTFATIYAAGATVIISATNPTSAAAPDWTSASDYCDGDCDFVTRIVANASLNEYLSPNTETGAELLQLFGGPGARIAYGYRNTTRCGLYGTPTHAMLGTDRCRFQYATFDTNTIRFRLNIDVWYYYSVL